MNPRPPLPPFTEETARQKVQAAEDAWNTRDPERVAGAYTADSVWRNRDRFLTGAGPSRSAEPAATALARAAAAASGTLPLPGTPPRSSPLSRFGNETVPTGTPRLAQPSRH